MLIIMSRSPLPLGLFKPRRIYGAGIRQTVLVDPEHGEYSGPIYILRKVTHHEYRDYYEDTYGVRLKYAEMRPPQNHFYEISID